MTVDKTTANTLTSAMRMVTFGEYLREALMWDTLLGEASMPGALLFHKDLGIPAPLKSGPPAGMRLTYSNHAKQAAMDDRLTSVPAVVPSSYTLIEVESMNGRASKWVIRFDWKDPTRDLILVIMADGFVKTVWTNAKNDSHKTLKRHLYATPAQYRSN